ncbi:MAG: hypothetical protein QOG15_2018, partial [Solirubrobacteraceae bacterium]|nr:hypothetical protein [Solirubrobacteraceae bacterium]
MILTRPSRLAVLSLSLSLLAALPAASASAKSTTKKRPTVSSVAPMTATVGDVLTIKGKNFILGRNRNRVFFKAGSNPAVAAKTPTSTRKLLHVVIPKGIQQYMNIKN